MREQQVFYGHCETLLYRGGDGFVITASMFNVILGLSNFKYTVKKYVIQREAVMTMWKASELATVSKSFV